MLLCAYYLSKGITPEHILNLSQREKIFYLASISWWSDKEQGKWSK